MRQEIRKFDLTKDKKGTDLETKIESPIILTAKDEDDQDKEYKLRIKNGLRYIAVSGMFDWELPTTSYVLFDENFHGFGETNFDLIFYESLVNYCEEHFLKIEELLE
jgi:hypothetical protein